MPVLVKFEKDWADEFDVYGFKVYPSKEAFEAKLGDITELTYSFGTNEGWEEEGEIIDEDFTILDISQDDADVLTKLFGGSWGHFPLRGY